MRHGGGLCYLDRVRTTLDGDSFRQWFRECVTRDSRRAIKALNDRALLFPSLFILLPEINEFELHPYMDQRYASACRFCDSITAGDKEASAQYAEPGRILEYQALKWLFATGAGWDAPQEFTDRFDAVMDAAAALLIVVYCDNSILPAAADLIFRRNRKKLLVHDLIWCYYQACDPDSLRFIAERLLSEDSSDRELACKVLHLPFSEQHDRISSRKQYQDYLNWLDENKGCLFFTGECPQMTSDPKPVRVHLEAKYLRKKVSPKDGKWLEPLSEAESKKLYSFTAMPDTGREALAYYSCRLHRKNPRSWRRWMHTECNDQFRIAAADMEASNDNR